jgi:hypothetical protein
MHTSFTFTRSIAIQYYQNHSDSFSQGLFEVVLLVLQLQLMPSCQQSVEFGEEDAETLSELSLLWSHYRLPVAQVDVLGGLHEDNSEADDGESPDVLHNVEDRAGGGLDDGFRIGEGNVGST